MSATAFGRRKTATAEPPSWGSAADLPTLKDLGYTPADDSHELRAFKRGFRRRGFAARGGLRWLAGVFGLAGATCFVAGWMELRWLFAVASLTCLIWSFLAPKTEPGEAEPA